MTDKKKTPAKEQKPKAKVKPKGTPAPKTNPDDLLAAFTRLLEVVIKQNMEIIEFNQVIIDQNGEMINHMEYETLIKRSDLLYPIDKPAAKLLRAEAEKLVS